MILTGREIYDLACAAGFLDITDKEERDMFEADGLFDAEISIKECPANGVCDENNEDPMRYRYIAIYEDDPSIGCMPLGPELPAIN